MADLQRLAEALTGASQDIFEVVKESDYDSRDSYIDALTRERLRRAAPEYAQERRAVVRELQAREEKEQRKAQAEEYSRIRSGITLQPFEVQAIDREAAELAKRDLASGKIAASGLADAITAHAKELTEKKKDKKAAAAQFNAILRGGR